jgi:taurine dioxygenase
MGEYNHIKVTPVTAVIGAQVDGVDLRQPLDDDVRDEVHEALMRHLVLFFRGQDLTEDEQLGFASHFGPPVSSSAVRVKDADDLLFVTIEDTADNPPKADRWHTDIPFVAQPPNIAVLHMREVPPVGGDTMWANLYAAYEALSPAMQRMIATVDLRLDMGTSRDAVKQMYGEEYYREIEPQLHEVTHPLVRVHPITGRPALYLCGAFMLGIAGMHDDESAALLSLLRTRLDDPNLQCRWRWEQYDVAMWDERCTNHRALADHYPHRRVVRRCLVGEGVPVGIDGRVY